MPKITPLPLQRRVTVREARDTVLLHIVSKTTAGVANDLSGYTFRGEVKAKWGADEPKICDVQFDNDLANGKVYAFLDEDDYDAIVAAVGTGGEAVADIKRISATGFDQQFAEFELPLALVATGKETPS